MTAAVETTDFAEMKTRLANLKIQKADLQREAAEMERELAAKEGEVAKISRQIEQYTATIYSSGGYSDGSTQPARVGNYVLPGGVRISAPTISSAEPVGVAKKAPGRPKREDIENAGGNSAQESLPTLIEKLLRDNKNGMTLADILTHIRSSGYVSLSKNPRTMIDQAIFRLKKKERIVRDQTSLKFFLKEEAA